MSDYHEISLRRYEEEQDQLYRERLEQDANPKFYWHIVTTDWDDYAYSKEEAAELIEQATMENLRYSCTEHLEGETYQ
jgi:hypothetical protein